MTEDDILAEDDVAAARPEEPGIEPFPQHQPDGPGPGLRRHHDQLVFKERRETGAADDQRRVPGPVRGTRREELLLGSADLHYIHPCALYHSSVRVTPSRRPTRGVYPRSCRARVISNARLFV